MITIFIVLLLTLCIGFFSTEQLAIKLKLYTKNIKKPAILFIASLSSDYAYYINYHIVMYTTIPVNDAGYSSL